MAACSIIKTTHYWLPDELWDIVKGYMGLCKEEHKVNWELIKKASLKDVLKMKLPKPTFELKQLKPKVVIDRNGGVVLRYSKGIKKDGIMCPKKIYFQELKKRYMRKRMMTPKRWMELSQIMTPPLTDFDEVKEGAKYKFIYSRTLFIANYRDANGVLHHNKVIEIQEGETVMEITKKLKTVIFVKFKMLGGEWGPNTWAHPKFTKKDFNYFKLQDGRVEC